MSPPSRNQVTNVPKPRPPSPHSLRCSVSSARRQRAAAKPTSVTTANKTMTMVKATALPLMSAHLPRALLRGPRAGRCAVPPCQPAEQVGSEGQDRDDRHPHELVPVEEREAAERRAGVVVERHPQRPDQGGCQQDRDHDPDAGTRACEAGLGHLRALLYVGCGLGARIRPRCGRVGCDACRVLVPMMQPCFATYGGLPPVMRLTCGDAAAMPAQLPRCARLIL